MARSIEEMTQKLWTFTTTSFAIKDAWGHFVEVNPSFCALTGYRRDELVGQHHRLVTHPDDLERTEAILADFRTGRTDELQWVKRYVTKAGQVVTCRKKLTHLDPDDRGLLILQAEDITSLTQLQGALVQDVAHLEEQNALQSRLMGILTHDLRGTTGGLAKLLAMSSEGQIQDSELTTVLRLCAQTMGQVQDFVENMLHWAQVQLSGVTPTPARVDVAEVVARASTSLALALRASQVGLSVAVAPSSIVAFDASSLLLIVRNLLTNAVKFAPAGSSIVVSFTASPHPVLEVVDSGPGFTDATLKALFHGQRVDSAKGAHGERGHGLGLLLSDDLARRLGGRLEADNCPGAGARLRLWFPTSAPDVG